MTAAAGDDRVLIGEGFAGEGADAAHLNVVIGARSGPVGAAWVTSLATPSAGHARFQVIAQPGVAVQPPTLFVPKALTTGGRHAELTWGAAQAGVAAGVTGAVTEGVFDPDTFDRLVVIAAVWVDPSADDVSSVFANNARAMHDALRSAHAGGPPVADALAASLEPRNPFFAG